MHFRWFFKNPSELYIFSGVYFKSKITKNVKQLPVTSFLLVEILEFLYYFVLHIQVVQEIKIHVVRYRYLGNILILLGIKFSV